jgi:hypothetical protein
MKDGEDQFDGSFEKLRSTTKIQGGKEQPAYSKTKEG